MEKALGISSPIFKSLKPQSISNTDVRTLMRTFIYLKLTLDVTTVLVLLFIFQAYTTKLQVVSEDISKQPTYDLESMQTQMNDISTFIKEHRELETKYASSANMLSKQLKEIQDKTGRQEYPVPKRDK